MLIVPYALNQWQNFLMNETQNSKILDSIKIKDDKCVNES